MKGKDDTTRVLAAQCPDVDFWTSSDRLLNTLDIELCPAFTSAAARMASDGSSADMQLPL